MTELSRDTLRALGSVTPEDLSPGPTGFRAGFGAGLNQALFLDNSNAEQRVLREAYQDLIEGTDLRSPFAPMRGDPRSRRSRRAQSAEDRISAFWAEVERRQDQDASFLNGRSRNNVETEIREQMEAVQAEAERLYGEGTGTAVGTFLGEAVGSFSDPANILTSPLGATAGMGIVKSALTEFVVGAGVEFAAGDKRTRWYEALGLPAPDPTTSALASGVASATLGTLPQALARAVQGGRMSLEYARSVQQRLEEMGPEETAQFVERVGVPLEPEARLALQAQQLETQQANALNLSPGEASATVAQVLDDLDRANVYAGPNSAPEVRDTTGTGTGRLGGPFDAQVQENATLLGFTQRVQQQESGGRIDAQSQTSTAGGLFGFTDPTWEQVRRERPDLGLPSDRRNATAAQQRAAMNHFTTRNLEALRRDLGRFPTQLELYGAHFFGRGMAADVARASDDTLLRDLYRRRSAWTEVRDANGFAEEMTVGAWRRRHRRRFGGAATGTELTGTQLAPTVRVDGTPISLTNWLKKLGGLRRNQTLRGDLDSLDLIRTRPGVISDRGLDLDTAARYAADAGFIERADPDTLLEAIRDDVAGRRRVVAQEQVGEALRLGETADRTRDLERLDEQITDLRAAARDAGIEAEPEQVEEALERAFVEDRDPIDILDDVVGRDVFRDVEGDVDLSDLMPDIEAASGLIGRELVDEIRGGGRGAAPDRAAPGRAGRGAGGAGAAGTREGVGDAANEDIPFFPGDDAARERPIEPGAVEAQEHGQALLREIAELPDDATLSVARTADDGSEFFETVSVARLRDEIAADDEFLSAIEVCRVA